jgi:hypothetical protein
MYEVCVDGKQVLFFSLMYYGGLHNIKLGAYMRNTPAKKKKIEPFMAAVKLILSVERPGEITRKPTHKLVAYFCTECCAV